MLKGPWTILIVLAIAFVATTYVFQLAGIAAWSFGIAILLLAKGFTKLAEALPFPSRHNAKIGGVVLIVATVLMYGVAGFPAVLPTWESILGMFGGAQAATLLAPASGQAIAQQVTACSASVSAEQKDDIASVTVNAVDLESAAGSSADVDLTSNCRFYADGNDQDHFIASSADTSNSVEADVWGMGSSAYVYCGGTTYYSEPIEGQCINKISQALQIKSHLIADASTEVDIVIYDKRGTVLTAAGNTTTADYDITLGANDEEKIFVEVNMEGAKASYNLYAFVTATRNDINKLSPEAGAGLTKKLTPEFLNDVTIGDDVGMGNFTADFDVYYLSSPVLLKEWQSVEYPFIVESGTTDPTATDNVFSTLDAGIICALDATYSQGSDGKEHLDIHDHQTDTEADVGFTNVMKAPVGGYDCAVLEGN